MIRAGIAVLVLMMGVLALASPALAANCYIATSQGSSGPNDWQSYCWIDFSTLNPTTAAATGGQNFSLTLIDGTVMSFNLQLNISPVNAVAAPSYYSASMGNTAFLGIAGKPVLYTTANTTITITISNIVLTPPAGATRLTTWMLAAVDGEETSGGAESLTFITNGGMWSELALLAPTTGSCNAPTSGIGTGTVTETSQCSSSYGAGVYLLGSTGPTNITVTMQGNQGVLFAVRAASLRLNTQITGARVAAADQFTYAIKATYNNAVLASASTSGTALNGFSAAPVVAASNVPFTLVQAMASGSTDTISHYQSSLNCSNTASGSSTVLPSAAITTSYALASLSYGDNITCTYTETPFPHLTLTKALGSGGRYFSSDQFILNINQGGSAVAATTTTGSGSTLASASTPQTQVTASTAYTLSEAAAAGSANLANYTPVLACTNANSSSVTTLPTTNGGTVTPAMGDVITCILTNTATASNARLSVTDTSAIASDPVEGNTNAKAIPGAIIAYSFNVTNTGPASVTANSVFLAVAVPAQISVGTAANPVFTDGTTTSGLTFAAGNIAFSNATTAPTSFAACTYTPVAANDPAVHYVCLNPQGTFAGYSGANTAPSFTLTINAQIN